MNISDRPSFYGEGDEGKERDKEDKGYFEIFEPQSWQAGEKISGRVLEIENTMSKIGGRLDKIAGDIEKLSGEITRQREKDERAPEAGETPVETTETGQIDGETLDFYKEGIRDLIPLILEILDAIDPSKISDDRAKRGFQRARIVVTYLDDKVDLFARPNTSADVKRQIFVFVIFTLGKAIQDQGEVLESPTSDTETEGAEGVAKSEIASFREWLRKYLGELADRFLELASGLMKPKEWTLAGELAAGIPGFVKKTAKIEIKFGT